MISAYWVNSFDRYIRIDNHYALLGYRQLGTTQIEGALKNVSLCDVVAPLIIGAKPLRRFKSSGLLKHVG